MSKLTIVANMIAHPDKIDLLKAEMLKVVPLTRAEAGCLQYDLHQDNDNPAHFMFYENWETRAHWQAHIKSQHMQAYKAATKAAVASRTLSEMTHIA